MDIVILEEGQNLQGSHFLVSWEIFDAMIRGTNSVLLEVDEYIKAVRFEGERGILICIGNKHDEQNMQN